MFPHLQVSIAAKKLGFQIRRVKRAGCMFSAANQTPTASVENGNKDQIPLHSIVVSVGRTKHNTCLINMAARESTRSQHALQRASITVTNMGITVHLPS